MKIIISAGGTGGHIYPALAIIDKIKEKEPNSEFIFIGTHNRMEKDIVPNHGINFFPIKVYGFSKKDIILDIKNIFYIKKATKYVEKIIKDFKPDIVVGVGGYVTYPVLKAAKKLGIKTFIHEQNAIPGKSNKVLSKFVDVVGVSFSESKPYFKNSKVFVTGNPCSERAYNVKPINKLELKLHEDKKLVLIVAGSLGSLALNNFFTKYLKSISKEEYEVMYITGKMHFEEFNKNKFPNNVLILPYYEDLIKVMKKCDLIISRSGATTISEIIALDIPNILIPSPYVPNNHQFHNANKLFQKNASILVEEKDLDIDDLKIKINDLLYNKEKINLMKNNLKELNIPNSSEYIYNIIKDMII